MVKARVAGFFSLILVGLIWLGAALPVVAQPIVMTSSTTASGGTALFKFAGTRPDSLGVKNGQLAACPASPNCVSSQSPSTDKEHFIAPLPLTSSNAEAIAKLKSIIEGLPRAKVIETGENYLYAEFTSALIGFVDDVEFYLDSSQGAIHVRSASRLGQSDLGVNRKRVEEIRELFGR